VQSDAPLSPGQSIDLILKHEVPVILSAQVVWVDVTQPTGSRQAGLKFTDPGNIPRELLAQGDVQEELA
jgi:hypothetical protein